jgi:signal peptide peptidase SppA
MLLAIAEETFWDWKAKIESPSYAAAVAEAYAVLRTPEAATTIVPGKKSVGSVAVIGLSGFMTQKPNIFSMLFGGTSTEAFAREVAAAMGESSIGAVVMNIDSPGGSVHGVPEAAAVIRAARGSKPLYAVSNPMAGSAAYWLMAQADKGRTFSIPSGIVGSIGTMVEHVDMTEALAKNGIKVTIIKHGQNKAEGHPSRALSADAEAHTQTIVDALGGHFEADVAAGREVTPNRVRADFGQGMMFHSAAAVAAGLVDGVATLDEVLASLTRPGARSAAAAIESERSYAAENAAAAALSRMRTK